MGYNDSLDSESAMGYNDSLDSVFPFPGQYDRAKYPQRLQSGFARRVNDLQRFFFL
jgi:hypothetical protein